MRTSQPVFGLSFFAHYTVLSHFVHSDWYVYHISLTVSGLLYFILVFFCTFYTCNTTLRVYLCSFYYFRVVNCVSDVCWKALQIVCLLTIFVHPLVLFKFKQTHYLLVSHWHAHCSSRRAFIASVLLHDIFVYCHYHFRLLSFKSMR